MWKLNNNLKWNDGEYPISITEIFEIVMSLIQGRYELNNKQKQTMIENNF